MEKPDYTNYYKRIIDCNIIGYYKPAINSLEFCTKPEVGKPCEPILALDIYHTPSKYDRFIPRVEKAKRALEKTLTTDLEAIVNTAFAFDFPPKAVAENYKEIASALSMQIDLNSINF